MFFKKIRHKEFDYIPRFYKPEEDDTEKRKKRLKFRYAVKTKRKTKVPIMLILFIAAIIYFIIRLNSMG